MLHTLSSSDSGYLHVQHEHSKITQFSRRRRKKLIPPKNVGTHCLLMRVSALAQSALVAATLALLHWPTAGATQDMTKQSQARLMLENNFLGTWEINWKRPRYVGFQWGGSVDIGQVSPQHCTRAKPWNRQICFKGYFSRPEPRKLVQGLVLAWACLGSWAPECFLVLHVHHRAYPLPPRPSPLYSFVSHKDLPVYAKVDEKIHNSAWCPEVAVFVYQWPKAKEQFQNSQRPELNISFFLAVENNILP